MPSSIAALIFGALIFGLFWLDRKPESRTSAALWIPAIWFALACSRSAGQWLNLSPLLNTPDQLLEGSPFDQFVYGGLLAAGLTVLATRRKQVGKLLQLNGPVILFFLFCACSFFWSDFPFVAFKRWIKAITDFVMVLVVCSERDPASAIRRLLAHVGYVLLPLSVLFIKYYPAWGREYGRWLGEVHYSGVTVGKNDLGAICMLFGLAAVWRFLAAYFDREQSDRRRVLMANALILAITFWLFVKASSMTALGCFILGTGVLLFARLRPVPPKPKVVHCLIAGILIVTVSVLFLGVGSALLEIMGRNSTLTDRTEVWATLLHVSGSPLVGTGYESFWLGPRLQAIWNVFAWKPAEAHNGYLEVYLNLGWVGIALLALVVATGYRTVINAWRRKQPGSDLMLAYFVVVLIQNFTEAAFFRMMAPAWIFFLLAITAIPQTSGAAARILQPATARAGAKEAPRATFASEELA